MRPAAFSELVRRRLALERGRVDKQAPFTVALGFPSPYAVAMSSLGPLSIRQTILAEPAMSCERAFVPDGGARGGRETVACYESLRPLAAFPVVALSVAYELELGGVVRLLEAGGVPALRAERGEDDPFVLAGGPLTWSNPLPLAPFVDAVVMGEADGLIAPVLRALSRAASRAQALDQLAGLAHVFVPARHGSLLPPGARAALDELPAYAHLRTPEAELSNMVLVEAARGCARRCQYCVMRRAADASLRLVPVERILAAVPPDAERVGLVGAAVSDHPDIAHVVDRLVDRGLEVGLSSLRPERLDEPLVAALRRAGYRTLTTALDGLSQRLRDALERRVTAAEILRAAELARRHGMARLKLYLMVGVPGETDEDVDEAARLIDELSRLLPVSLAASAFCAKRNTPLAGASFAGIGVVERRLRRLRRALRGRAEVRATSVRWAWVEHALAAGAEAHGLAVYRAVREGGSFRAYEAALRAADEER